MKKALMLTLCMIFAVCAYAWDLNMIGEASIGGKDYNIVGQFNRNRNETFSGRYAYKSTIKKMGNVKKAYLYVTPTDASGSNYVVKDASGKVVEYWYNVNEIARNHYYAILIDVRTTAGKYFTIELRCPY